MLRLVRRCIPALATAALLAAGCGGGNGSQDSGNGGSGTAETTSTSTTAGTSAPATGSARSGANAVAVRMKEFAFVPGNVTAQAGKVTIAARNTGSVPHELVLLKADRPPGALPAKGAGAAEDGPGVRVLGRTGHVAPGASGRLTENIRPGVYVMICNLPGHYRSGMYGSFTAK
jgi:uncharacterized cupredoxin-like copper-binding protein